MAEFKILPQHKAARAQLNTRMTGSVASTVALCVVFIALVLVALYYSVTREPVPSEASLREQGIIFLPKPRDIAPFELQAMDGGPFTRDMLEGQWSFLFFGFTHCPDICPASLSIMAQAERRLQDSRPELLASVRAGLVSVDPERDDPETLKRYVTAFSPEFVGVTGEREAIAELARQVNVAFGKVPAENGYTVDHTGNIVVINPRGHYHGFIKSPHTVDKVVAAYQAVNAGF